MSRKEVFSNDAEVAVLSLILNNPEVAYEIEGLKSFMFSASTHQELFSEIENCVENQIPTDMGLMYARLESSNAIGKVGGKGYLDTLGKQSFSVDTFSEYKKIVIDSYKTRFIISMGSGLTSDKISVDNVDDVLGQLRGTLDNLLESRGGLQTLHIGDIVKDVYQEIITRRDKDGIKGASFGIPDIDTATGGKCPGELWVIGGRPGQGKTAFICNSILTDARAGVPSLVFEREMRNQELTERFISLMTLIPITNIRLGILTSENIKQIYSALEELKGLPIYIDTSYRSTDLHYIESTIMKYKRLHDIQVVYLDYIQILVDRTDNQTNEIGRISRLFKSIANELNICTILLSQLNRGVESRDDKRPILSDLRQSGNLEEDADIVVGLYRDEYYNKETRYKGLMEFIILKYRNGPVGTMSLKFHADTNKMSGV